MANAATTDRTTDGFQSDFAAVLPLIREEWPAVEADALERTNGDYDRVVALIAERTEHTKTLVKRQLDELHEISKGSAAGDGAGDAARIQQLLRKVQGRTQEISDYVRKQLVTDAKAKVEQNLIISLLMAIGLGFLLGFLLRGLGGRGRGGS